MQGKPVTVHTLATARVLIQTYKEAAAIQTARLATYEAALAPFVALAKAYKEHSGAWLDDHTVYSFNGVGITLGDLKRARKALGDA